MNMENRKFLIISLFISVFLTSCATDPAQEVAKRRCESVIKGPFLGYMSCMSRERENENNRINYENEAQRQAAYAEALKNRCYSFGFQANTPAFAQCIYQQQQVDIQNNANANAIRLQQQQQGLQQMQQGMQMLSPQRPVNPTFSCTKLPGSYTTTCQ